MTPYRSPHCAAGKQAAIFGVVGQCDTFGGASKKYRMITDD
jgi:hypothetical protein